MRLFRLRPRQRALVAAAAGLVLGVGLLPAFAADGDPGYGYTGGWKGPNSDEYSRCMVVGTYRNVEPSPWVRHLSAGNACAASHNVEVYEAHVASDGSVLNDCYRSPRSDYAHCSMSVTAVSGDHYNLYVWLYNGTTAYGWTCYSGVSGGCFNSSND